MLTVQEPFERGITITFTVLVPSQIQKIKLSALIHKYSDVLLTLFKPYCTLLCQKQGGVSFQEKALIL